MLKVQEEKMGRLTVDLVVANNQDVQMAEGGAISADKIRQTQLQGVVDTGAACLVIPKATADQLGLKPSGEVTVPYADRRTAQRLLVEEVRAELMGRHGTFKAVVEPDRTTARIGAIVLEDLDLLVDCQKQTLRPRDPGGYVAELE